MLHISPCSQPSCKPELRSAPVVSLTLIDIVHRQTPLRCQGCRTERTTARHATACRVTTAAQFVTSVATLHDIPAVANVSGQAFGFGNFPGVESELLDRLEQRYAVVIEQDTREKMAEALDYKAECAAKIRAQNLLRRTNLLRQELARLRGEPATYVTAPTPAERREHMRLRRGKMFLCLVAREKSTGKVAGCVTLSFMQPEAWLPPPFPSGKPWRLYISNMAVARSHRRQGVARSLLAACIRIGGMWRQPSIWLHVHCTNAAARKLYAEAGFQTVSVDPPFYGPLRQQLMARPLAPRPTLAQNVSIAGLQPENMSGSLGMDKRTFVWSASQAADAE